VNVALLTPSPSAIVTEYVPSSGASKVQFTGRKPQSLGFAGQLASHDSTRGSMKMLFASTVTSQLTGAPQSHHCKSTVTNALERSEQDPGGLCSSGVNAQLSGEHPAPTKAPRTSAAQAATFHGAFIESSFRS
jgi:hypothetical protein